MTNAEKIKRLQAQVSKLQAHVDELSHLTKPPRPKYPTIDIDAQRMHAQALATMPRTLYL